MEENTNITVKEGKEPIVYLKGVKSETEIKNLKIAHRKTALLWSVLPSTLRAAWQEKRP